MILGIDVGGTYTDGVLIEDTAVISTAKAPTDSTDLPETLLKVTAQLTDAVPVEKIKRVVLSTTLVTNLLATGQAEKIAVILIPGTGLPFSSFALFPHTYFLKGTVDFRGKVVEKLESSELDRLIKQLVEAGFEKFVIAGKFSQRNDQLIKEVKSAILNSIPQATILLDSEVAGQLNFMRRIATAYYSMYALEPWRNFAEAMYSALSARGIKAEIEILKADGGTMSLDVSLKNPCETIFSGPAASIMGGLALNQEEKNAIVLDIGGTTSDIALLIDAQPLYASKGARINGNLTHIRSFSVASLALGGDSPVELESGQPVIKPIRQGPALCLGGKQVTVTDIFNLSQNLNLGNVQASQAGINQLAKACNRTPEKLLNDITAQVLSRLEQAITSMFREWRDEPAYKVWEITHGKTFEPTSIIGIGAAASAIVPLLAQKLKVNTLLSQYSPIANALGAALARPTLDMRLHADTSQKFYTVDPGNVRITKKFPWNTQISDIKQLAEEEFAELTRQNGIEDYFVHREFYHEEQFNLIRGWDTEGKIFDVGLQIAPGIIEAFKGVKLS